MKRSERAEEGFKNSETFNEYIKEDKMNFFGIISDERTKFITKIKKLIGLMVDLIFLLLIGFAVLFFYLKSQVGWIFVFLAITRYITEK